MNKVAPLMNDYIVMLENQINNITANIEDVTNSKKICLSYMKSDYKKSIIEDMEKYKKFLINCGNAIIHICKKYEEYSKSKTPDRTYPFAEFMQLIIPPCLGQALDNFNLFSKLLDKRTINKMSVLNESDIDTEEYDAFITYLFKTYLNLCKDENINVSFSAREIELLLGGKIDLSKLDESSGYCYIELVVLIFNKISCTGCTDKTMAIIMEMWYTFFIRKVALVTTMFDDTNFMFHYLNKIDCKFVVHGIDNVINDEIKKGKLYFIKETYKRELYKLMVLLLKTDPKVIELKDRFMANVTDEKINNKMIDYVSSHMLYKRLQEKIGFIPNRLSIDFIHSFKLFYKLITDNPSIFFIGNILKFFEIYNFSFPEIIGCLDVDTIHKYVVSYHPDNFTLNSLVMTTILLTHHKNASAILIGIMKNLTLTKKNIGIIYQLRDYLHNNENSKIDFATKIVTNTLYNFDKNLNQRKK